MSGDPGMVLAELDMLLTAEQYQHLYSKAVPSRRQKRKVYQKTEPWKDGLVPYVLNPWDFSKYDNLCCNILHT